MRKSRLLFTFIFCCFILGDAQAQQSKGLYTLHIHFIDKDRSFDSQPLKLQTVFMDRLSCNTYISGLIALLGSKGYPAASVDSSLFEESGATIRLYLGKQYHWIRLSPGNIEKSALEESSFSEKAFSGKLLNISQLQNVEKGILNYYEKNGFPFAAVYLDSVRMEEDKINAILSTTKGTLYHIDSMRIMGNGKISKKFLQHYLGIPNGSIYKKDRLEQVSKRMLELPYVKEIQPSDITMLGQGAVLNLYLTQKRSSQANFLIGFLPAAGQTGKLQLTADVNLDLKNALSSGESILLNWQQLQVQSPRLNLGYHQPYIFNSPFGIDFSFNLFKKDSTFLQLNGQLGLQYVVSARQSGNVFVQWQHNFLLGSGVDTSLVIATKKLPPDIDVSSVNFGINYEWNNTDYRLNPMTGNEWMITGSVGLKNIKQNNEIVNIKDPSFNYSSLYDSIRSHAYQFRIKLSAAHYFPIGKQAAVKTALNTGIFSSQDIFRNELFQIGGYRLLRGFDEESIYATQYGVLTTEYRYRLALNSFLFGFIDAGWVNNNYQSVHQKNTYVGTGLGLAFETRFGLLNISYALGKRNDVIFNIREASKIHFGYVNYF